MDGGFLGTRGVRACCSRTLFSCENLRPRMSLPQVQIAGYGVLLWAVNVSDTSRGEYSVLSIAVAMYLNISIDSPDLWGSFGLITVSYTHLTLPTNREV